MDKNSVAIIVVDSGHVVGDVGIIIFSRMTAAY